MNRLYFGDNLEVLRQHIKDESVDLIYLDPPFNSNATYNVLFKERGDVPSEAQAEAFRDTWGWGPSAAIAFDDLRRGGGKLSALIVSLREWLGDTGMMAYLAMMGIRLVELHRVLKRLNISALRFHREPLS
jgi:adenine specific DNA methylase Mod